MYIHFGNLILSREKKHRFLEMDIEFLCNGKLYLFMKGYIEESIDMFQEDLSAAVSSPANKGLQNIDEIPTRIEKKYAEILHSIDGKILWVAKRGVPTLSQIYRYYAPE